MGRRHIVDEETAAIATERLARLLDDHGPRRALPTDSGDNLTQTQPETRSPPPRDRGTDLEPAEVEDVSPGRTGASPARTGASPARTVTSSPSLSGLARELGRRHLGVLIVVLVIGLGAAGWALIRARPVAQASPIVVSTSVGPTSVGPTSAGTSGAGGESSGPTSPASTRAPEIRVHVVGAVRTPGVVSLPQGSRVEDAIEAAGGLTRAARPGRLNLAQVVQDGQQIQIGSARDPGGQVSDGSTVAGSTTGGATGSGAGRGGSGSAADGSGGPLDLNAASAAQLDTLPGVGPVTAERIIAWRMQHGRFSRVEELQEVDGIGPKTYAEIAPHVRV